MPDFPARNVIRLHELVWPISWRWHIQAPWGTYNTVLSVEAPSLVDNVPASQRLGKLLYALSVAPATTISTRPTFQETVCWKNGDVPTAEGVSQLQGARFGATSARSSSPVMVMLTGHEDGRGKRRLYFGGAPAAWSDGEQLRVGGAERLQEIGRSLIAGMVAGTGDLLMRWMLAYPRSVPISGPIGQEVSFRPVTSLRICSHVERTPELSQLIWPQPD